ncbi:hypothetical protein ACHAXT_001664 [Thalassiosira profunda]
MPTAKKYTARSLGGACLLWFLLGGALGLMMGIIFLMEGYEDNTQAFKAKRSVKDFVSIGQRCRIEAIDYHASTSVSSTYGCDEYWTYDFVVLESEGVIDAEIDAGDLGLRTVSEHRPACATKSCSDCSASNGKYALNDGKPVEDGHFATGCWLFTPKRDGAEASSFWSCSTGGYNDTSCYLLNDPKEILNAHLKQPRKYVIAGWALIAGSIFLAVPFLYFCGKEEQWQRPEGTGEATSQQEDEDY